MADVKWIKIATEIFDNRKIKQIEKMPEGDAIIVVWFKLLCLAGNINDGGMIYFTKEMPYTEEMLSVEFNRPIQTIRLAITTFERFGMIEVVDDVFYISSWDKYQNVEGLERIREQTRKRVAKYRENKLIEDSNATCNVTVTQGNATDKNKNKNKIREDKEKKEIKNKYGAYAHVLLKDSELEKLNSEYGELETEEAITYLDEYIEMKGAKYKSHYLVLRKWVFDAVRERKNKSGRGNMNVGCTRANDRDVKVEHENELLKLAREAGVNSEFKGF